MQIQPVRWSYSSLKQFENCARAYYEIRVKKAIKQQDTEKTIYGKEAHAAAENHVKDKGSKEFDPRFKYMAPVVQALLNKPGDKYPEHALACTSELVKCAFDAPNYWLRGIADLLIVNSHKAWVVDYKTGKSRYADTDQLEVMALLTFLHFPQVTHVHGGLLFVTENKPVFHEVSVAQAPDLWWKYRNRVAKIEAAHATNVWHPKQSGLCKGCPVTSCEHNPNH